LTVGEALAYGAAALAAAGVDSPGLDARLLLAHAMGVDQATLLRDRAAVAPAGYAGLVARRAAREPLAFIVGRQGFWTLDLEVSRDTLIPRADTETLVEAVLAARGAARGAVRRVLDLGTGTGCLLLAVLSEFPGAWGVGVDISPAAAALAARNARSCGLADRAAFIAGDWAAALDGRFDVVVSNPPYIAGGAIAGLMPEVGGFEPRRALDGGADGLDAYRVLIGALPTLLAPGGLAVLELGAGQDGAVCALAAGAGFGAGLRADLGGVPRALVLEKKLGSDAAAY
jgi:release factor glutamine methyltransferase